MNIMPNCSTIATKWRLFAARVAAPVSCYCEQLCNMRLKPDVLTTRNMTDTAFGQHASRRCGQRAISPQTDLCGRNEILNALATQPVLSADARVHKKVAFTRRSCWNPSLLKNSRPATTPHSRHSFK